METINVNWSDIKIFANERNLSLQYIVSNNAYQIRAIDGDFCLACRLPLDNSSDQIDFETNFIPKANVKIGQMSPFSSKTFGSKKLFRRVHGVGFTLNDSNTNSGITVVNFTIPYSQVKITEAEILWAPEGIFVDFEVYDTAVGTYSTIPNFKLNQFGFGLGVAKDVFCDDSSYDADLYGGMVIRATFHNNTNATKTMCVNFILHEVK
jgi:hypothetical protein